MQQNINIEIYGVLSNNWKCYSCESLKKICNDNDLLYTFYNVIKDDVHSDDVIPNFDVPLIRQLANRMDQESLRIQYPVIFVNGERVLFKHFREHMFDLGYDVY